MGTEGVRIVRFCGRYFIYYNIRHSYPRRFGKAIVSSIPSELEKYQEWLQAERDRYGKITDELESKVLTVTEDELDEGMVAAKSRPRWKEIDHELYEVPTIVLDVKSYQRVEWTYLIDLDDELFSVNDWIFFDLWNIPADRFAAAFQRDINGNGIFDSHICPEGSTTSIPSGYFEGREDQRNRYNTIAGQYEFQFIKPRTIVDPHSSDSLQQVVALVFFEKFTKYYASQFSKSFQNHRPGSLGFKEAAFVVLSFAAGRFYLGNRDHFDGKTDHEKSEGYLIERDTVSGHKLTPLFGSGCHMLGHEPGSAPETCMYWLRNVLISLVPHRALQTDLNFVIAKTVEHGREQGRSTFNAVLFSICDAVLLQVQFSGVSTRVRCTEVISIYHNSDTDNDAGMPVLDDGKTHQGPSLTPLAKLRLRYRGFVALQTLFAQTAMQSLTGFNQGAFPTEIYSSIIHHVDSWTHMSCVEASPHFYALCQNECAFDRDLTMIGLNANVESWGRASPSSSRSPFFVEVSELGTFTFQNNVTAQLEQSPLDAAFYHCDGGDATLWSPVIRSESRPTMVAQVSVNLRLQAK